MKFKGKLEFEQDYDNISIRIRDEKKQDDMTFYAVIELTDIFRKFDGKIIEVIIKEVEK